MTQYRPETIEAANLRRQQQAGEVNFAAMYAAHDSFAADTTALLEAARKGEALSTDAVAIWSRFSQQLHNHHTSEDELLWPMVRAVASPADVALLDQMETEHGALNAGITRLIDLYKDGQSTEILIELENLRPLLDEHLFNEEVQALPLIERTIGAEGWDAYGQAVRSRAATH
ncbi:hemerythrin domain-containing protein [Pseudoclavibacter helvolus]|uniref:hemerythrin domain-containing protein n=1 Tax=Pseudoclavibacter helvolus TaxID=255205 RepID=UPI0024AE5616|nr:hemerythrin domain-containing protein [Pseudoclavibacter helvolus]